MFKIAEIDHCSSNPSSDPGSDPSSDPSSDPGSDPSSDPGSDPSSNPGSKFRYPRDRSLLDENWQPISLVNVDTKIMSKVIASRIKKVLP